MARDFLALQNECMQFGYGERERPFFKTWLNEASYDVATRHRWRWLDTNTAVTTVANQSFANVPVATIMIPERLRPNQTGLAEPGFIPWNTYADEFMRKPPSATRGAPRSFSFIDDKLEFYPTPDAVYAYTLYYYAAPVEMVADADVPWMPNEQRGVLVSGALMKMALRDKDAQTAQMWQDQYEGQIAKMRTAHMLVNSQTPNKIAMPRNYGWRS